MYEDMSFDVIMDRMLEGAIERNPGVDTREGSIIWDALAPAAIELVHLYIQLDVVLNQTFADTASREYLIMRCRERGIEPYPATKAVLKGIFNVDVPIGARFSLDTLNYMAVEKMGTGIFKMQCETAGVDGGRHLGMLIPIDYIDGLQTASLTEVLIPGEDEEDTELLRARYMDSFDSQAYGGNIRDYQEKVNALPGVGGVKVYPVWQGGGTVKLVIINSEYKKPSEALVKTVQQEVHPVSAEGVPNVSTSGTGIAPIGHVVTVFGVDAKRVDVDLTLTLRTGWKWEDVENSIQEAIDDYFIELGRSWEKEDALVVRISQLELRILGLNGILDVGGTLLNGIGQNLALDADTIPIRGEVHGVSI